MGRFVEQEREEESEDDSESEEEEEEYMEDGELQRKGSKGFKLLNNCKRFWAATQRMGQRKAATDLPTIIFTVSA